MNVEVRSGVWVSKFSIGFHKLNFESSYFVNTKCELCLILTELESYSNVVGAFRAQGTLNAAKLRILKDLREAFHISDARHKAEVRRVVNDESLSTIAKMYVSV